jgi:putative ABC transport system permease protein
MSIWTRITNVFRADKLNREIDEELRSHMDAALEAGRDPHEASRAFGSPLKHRDEAHDARVFIWLDSLRADAIYGWRRLAHSKVTTAAAVLSLALAIGACTAAFRIVDALILTPLPVKAPHELYSLARNGMDPQGKPQIAVLWQYPLFLKMREGVKADAELLASTGARIEDVTYSTDDAMEKVRWTHVSGGMFDSFALKPAAGRLLNANDDTGPSAKRVVILSERYWERRFGRDPNVIGRTIKRNNQPYEIVGVVAAPFTGMSPGVMTDVFAPMSASDFATNPNVSWFHTFLRVPEGRSPERVRAELDPIVYATRDDDIKNNALGMTEQQKRDLKNQTLMIAPASTGVSNFRNDNRDALLALSALVGLVLLIACANVANLMTAQAAARERELALRVSIGGGRRRLVQLVLVESAWIGVIASALGAAFAWWAAPLVIALNSRPDAPVQLALPADWRVLGFALALTFAVTLLFGLAPALRASKVDPSSALKGGEDPHARRRTMNLLIAAQVAFCFLVVFVSGMFVATFERLSHKPTGFSAERVLALTTASEKRHSAEEWDSLVARVQQVPGVERAAVAGWPLMNDTAWDDLVAFNGGPPSDAIGYFIPASPEWMNAMKIPIVEGRAIRAGAAGKGEAVVNREFVNMYFHGADPVGQIFENAGDPDHHVPYQVVGVIGDLCYNELHECALPVAVVSFYAHSPLNRDGDIQDGTLIVRTVAQDPSSMAATLRQAVADTHTGFRVTNVRTQQSINDIQTMRERMLAILALFFAVVALVLAGVGLYGVMNYSVLQRQREIGVRIAVGARSHDIARSVVAHTALMVLVGAAVGIAFGLAASRSFEALLYNVKATSLTSLGLPCAAIFASAVVASLPAIIRAVRIDPVILLRSE